MNKNYFVGIMAGGIGSRFWPESRSPLPKQFLDILNIGETLIQSTYKRFAKFIPKENIYIITAIEYVHLVQEQLPDITKDNILAEPAKKNTAPCVAYFSSTLQIKYPQAIVLMSPSDHLILDESAFKETCLQAFDFAEHRNALVTLGIKPTHPNTGYGYIQYNTQAISSNAHIYKVKIFTEKPNEEMAKMFISSGDFLWNAGIFIWQVENIMNNFKIHQPEIFELFDNGKKHWNTPEENKIIQQIYSLCTNISIDIAILEKATNIYTIPSNFGWSDLGAWNSIYENADATCRDDNKNVSIGKNIIHIDSKECFIYNTKDKLMVIQGLENMIVVDTTDALLICNREKEQNIKDFLAIVKKHTNNKYL